MPLPGNCTPSRHIATSLNVELCLATAKATFLARIVSLSSVSRVASLPIVLSLSLSLSLWPWLFRMQIRSIDVELEICFDSRVPALAIGRRIREKRNVAIGPSSRNKDENSLGPLPGIDLRPGPKDGDAYKTERASKARLGSEVALATRLLSSRSIDGIATHVAGWTRASLPSLLNTFVYTSICISHPLQCRFIVFTTLSSKSTRASADIQAMATRAGKREREREREGRGREEKGERRRVNPPCP